jgi:hypothetical protein
MQRLQAAHPDRLREPVHDLGELVGRPDVEAGREHVAGVEADADALVAARAVDQLAELLEGPADGAGAGCVLKQETAVIGLGQPTTRSLPKPP